jgi:Tripartite tricarboxylate transporter TctB family
MSMESAPEGEVSARADLVSAVLWMAFGGAVAIGAWRMDRLERLNINRYEAPGLVPGLLGAMVLLLGVMLAVRAIRAGALAPAGRHDTSDWGRMALVMAAMLGYSLVLVGHGLPFWLVTGAFVMGFIFFFDRERQTALGRPLWRQGLLALICGVATSAIVSFSFQEIFYVRLP